MGYPWTTLPITRYEMKQYIEYIGCALIVGAVALIIMTSCGFFAQPYGLYVETQGLTLEGGSDIAFSHAYVVKEDRRPGPDRVVAVFNDAGQAWYYMRTYPKSPAPELFQNAGGN